MNDDADFSPTTLLQGTPDGQAARARRPNHKLTEAQKDYVIRRLAAYAARMHAPFSNPLPGARHER